MESKEVPASLPEYFWAISSLLRSVLISFGGRVFDLLDFCPSIIDHHSDQWSLIMEVIIDHREWSLNITQSKTRPPKYSDRGEVPFLSFCFVICWQKNVSKYPGQLCSHRRLSQAVSKGVEKDLEFGALGLGLATDSRYSLVESQTTRHPKPSKTLPQASEICRRNSETS